MTDQQHPATERAHAVAQRAVTAEHGDNDPRATLDLEHRFGIGGLVDRTVPRLLEPHDGRAMCAAWSDHQRSEQVAHG